MVFHLDFHFSYCRHIYLCMMERSETYKLFIFYTNNYLIILSPYMHSCFVIVKNFNFLNLYIVKLYHVEYNEIRFAQEGVFSMETNIVRLEQIEIHNIKNVAYGKINLATGDYQYNEKGSILGIYGQNGSGKTVVVDVMVLLKALLSGKKIPDAFLQFIRYGEKEAFVRYRFHVKTENARHQFEYEVHLLKEADRHLVISLEQLSQKNLDTDSSRRLTPVFRYVRGGKSLFTPIASFRYFEKRLEDMVSLSVAHQLSESFNDEKQLPEITSFLFSAKAQEVFSKAKGDPYKIYQVSSVLQRFGRDYLAVIENAHYGLLALNLTTIPMNMKWPASLAGSMSGVMVRLTDVNILPKELFPYFESNIKQINIVLGSLVPDLKLEIYHPFDKLMEDGSDGIQFELISIRGQSRIPLLYESAGIKKLISICSNLVCCYNQESYCLVVDELDSGIYEYLLGEYLQAVQEEAKGQLIFTSHNLRPLEVLERNYLIYTTVNPDNRYSRTNYIKNTQNKRLSYMRTIKLGGQKEKFYQDTSLYEIELAFKEAGRVGIND